jgi:16S rRNA (guanine(966)-N(2))-methyltransferase RsmD
MRIVAGAFRGRRLTGPRADGVRPTSDRLRETLFNVLGASVVGATVLDAFSGTGALGLEALSRGAVAVTFVERDRSAIDVIDANVRACGASNACVIIRDDFLAVLDRRARPQPWRRARFDLVLLDPPYDVPDLAAVVALAGRLVQPGGLVVLEHSARRESPADGAGLVRMRVLEAGDSALSFYEPRSGSMEHDIT